VAVGVGVCVAVAVGVGVSVAVAVGVGVSVAVAVGVGVSVAVAVGVGVLVAVAVGVGVSVAVAVGVGVSVAVAVGVGVGVGADIMVMLPGGVLPGAWLLRSASTKKKWPGGTAHVSAVLATGVLLTLVIFRLNRVPEPDSGVKSLEKAAMRSVLIVPGPVLRMLEETFQLTAVSPAACTCGVVKLTFAESKVRSPWNPTRLSAGLIAEVTTG